MSSVIYIIIKVIERVNTIIIIFIYITHFVYNFDFEVI